MGSSGRRVKSAKGGDIDRRRTFGKAGLLAVAFALSAPAAAALPDSPSIKPRQEYRSERIDAAQFRAISRGLDAAEDGRWSDFRSALAQTGDPGGAALLRWRQAIDPNGGLGFASLASAVDEFAGWPDQSKIVELAENTILSSSLTADERIAWLKAHGPQTPRGYLALLDSYLSQARSAELRVTGGLPPFAARQSPLRLLLLEGDADVEFDPVADEGDVGIVRHGQQPGSGAVVKAQHSGTARRLRAASCARV